MIHLCFCRHQNLFQTALLKTMIQGQDGAYKIVSFTEAMCLPFYGQRELWIEVTYHQVLGFSGPETFYIPNVQTKIKLKP